MSADGLYGKCSGCGHVFLLAKLPMEVSKVAKLALRAGCTQCGATAGIVVASAEDVVKAGTA